MRIIYRAIAGVLLFAALSMTIADRCGSTAFAQASQRPVADKPFVVEYYYKARWGFADEFIRLFKKNHFPVLNKEKELGRILAVTAASPRYHGTEDGRWDYRVTITWKNVGVTEDGFDATTVTKQLFPDQDTFKREEQRRFEILLAHWDLPIVDVDLNK
ncbi:MAG: hypothetical protein ND895_00625 [Pyrinomonadaceae bacterium]|nr:hypothetical protein [Pyrinomonadaceae bacterium]